MQHFTVLTEELNQMVIMRYNADRIRPEEPESPHHMFPAASYLFIQLLFLFEVKTPNMTTCISFWEHGGAVVRPVAPGPDPLTESNSASRGRKKVSGVSHQNHWC